MAEIQKENPNADLNFLEYDVSSLKAVHATGQIFLNENVPLDILMLNAGAIIGDPQASKDGLEWMFAINHLAPFTLATTLPPAIKTAAKQSGDATITSATSAGFSMHPDESPLHIADDDLDINGKTIGGKTTPCQCTAAQRNVQHIIHPGAEAGGQGRPNGADVCEVTPCIPARLRLD